MQSRGSLLYLAYGTAHCVPCISGSEFTSYLWNRRQRPKDWDYVKWVFISSQSLWKSSSSTTLTCVEDMRSSKRRRRMVFLEADTRTQWRPLLSCLDLLILSFSFHWCHYNALQLIFCQHSSLKRHNVKTFNLPFLTGLLLSSFHGTFQRILERLQLIQGLLQ